jgi:hypothetical protein
MAYSAPNILPSGTTFAQLQAGGLSGHLERLIAANLNGTSAPSTAPTVSAAGGGQSLAAPSSQLTVAASGGGRTLSNPSTQATASATGGGSTGGSLPAGTYYVGYTFVTAAGGETTLGTSTSAQLTVAAGDIPTATLPALPTGAVAMNVYLTPTGGANTALYLYAKGATGVTFALASSTWYGNVASAGLSTAGISPPASNSTAGGLGAVTIYVACTQYHAHGETTVGSSTSASTALTAGYVPSVVLPSPATGSLGVNVYVGNSATALTLYASGLAGGSTLYLSSGSWTNGTTTQAAAASPPSANTTIGALAPGTYYAKVTESNGLGETTATTDSASFTVASQSNPSTAATGAGSGSSGNMTAGAYLASYAYVDNNGNTTTVGTTETASAVTITAGQSLVVTFNDTVPSWVVSRTLYVTAPGGASGSETMYASGISPAATTYTCSNALWSNNTAAQSAAAAVPAANTTGVDVPRITKPALQSGNTSWNLYLTPAGGAAGSEVLYADGLSSLTFDCTAAAPANSYAVAPPATNSTSLTYTDAAGNTLNRTLQYLRSVKTGNVEDVYRFQRTHVANFLRGNPMKGDAAVRELRHAHVVWAALAQLSAEVGTLMDANAGTIRPGGQPTLIGGVIQDVGIGQISAVRTFP